MSDIGYLVERLVEAGLSVGEASSIIAEAVAAGAATAAYRKSPGALRTERWRENKRHKASQSVTERHENETSPTVTKRHQPSQCDAAPLSIDKTKKEKKGESRATQIADDFRPDSVRWEAAVRIFGEEGAQRELRKFTANSKAKGLKYKNWQFAWDTWVERAIDWGPNKPAKPLGVVNPETTDWRKVLESYVRFNHWPKGHGNDPTLPGCRAPPELLREFGLLKTA